jgi:hypothetical protein
MKNIYATIHKGLAMFIALGVFVQMLLAGVWHSGVVNTPDAHAIFGISLLLASLLALLAAAVGKLPKAILSRTGLLFFLILLQPILMETRGSGLAIISAFHALNAPFIGIVASTVVAMARGVQVEGGEERAVSPVTGD